MFPFLAISFFDYEIPMQGYYALCAFSFTICGLITGYFIWRKGHMQTIDAEIEVKRTEKELQRLFKELRIEEEGLSLGKTVNTDEPTPKGYEDTLRPGVNGEED